VYDDLTLDGTCQEGRIYGTRETQRRIAVERMIQSQVKSARKTEPPRVGNPGEGNVSLWLLEWVFTFVRDVEINTGFCLEFLMLPFPVRPDDWELEMPYWNAMNLMEREVLVRLQKATATNTLIAQQYTETMDITANEFFKNIINLFMGQPLQLYTSNKAACWHDLKQTRTENVGKYINKIQKFGLS